MLTLTQHTTNSLRRRNKKVAVHSCPNTPMNAGREQRSGGTVGRVWSSRGAQQGVARCTHAGPWLDSNLFVTLPLRNAVVMCRPLITPDNCWHKTTWPEFQPSLPPGLVDHGIRENVVGVFRVASHSLVCSIPIAVPGPGANAGRT